MRTLIRVAISVFLLITAAVTAKADKGDIPPIQRSIIEKVFSEFNLDKENYEIELLSNNIKRDSAGQDQMTVHPLTLREPIGLFTIILKIWDNGTLVESGQVRMRISRFAEVLVTTDKIKSRSVISEELLETKRMDVTNLVDKPILSHEELAGYRARRNLSRGQILTTASLEPIPDVERGNEVQIVYADGTFHITAAGIALQTGCSGDYVKVRNKSSGKIIVARVVDHSAVAIDP